MTEGQTKLELYKSSIELFKHFNNLVDKVRIIVITSGILVFVAAGKVYSDDWSQKETILLLISIFGIAFISSMWLLANHYLIHTESIARGARSIEAELLGKNQSIDGAFMRIHLDHNIWKLKALENNEEPVGKKPFGDRWKKKFFDYSTFMVMWLECLGLLISSLILYLTSS